jgi:hypothetical protein
MTLKHFRHQAVQGATASGHELKHARTFVLTLERPLDGLDLSANPPNPTQELHFVFCCVRHSLRPSLSV